jgi:hypothetical protein
MRWLFDFLYGSVPAEFESRFGLDESARKLSAATRRDVFLITKSVAVGNVSKDSVSLCRVMPFYGTFFYFFGEFREHNGSGCPLWTFYPELVHKGFDDVLARLLLLLDVSCGVGGFGPRPTTMVVSTHWSCDVWSWGDVRVVP